VRAVDLEQRKPSLVCRRDTKLGQLTEST
jgi:hypothetical protein